MSDSLVVSSSPNQEMVSGQELFSWRDRAREGAIAANILPKEVDWLLQEITELDSLALRLGTFRERSQLKINLPLWKLTELWQQRLQEKVPVQYLVGIAPWRNFSLKVSPEVLIPRPETEYLIDLAITATKETKELERGNWVDLGTGSGAIALGLADAFPDAVIHAVDYSKAALAIARENARKLGFEQVKFYQGSWWEPLDGLKGKVSGMVSNPPYIPTACLAELQPEVVNHEPHLALDGGDDGLDCIRYLVDMAPEYLHRGGIWLIEMMAGQAEEVVQLLRRQGSYSRIEIFSDLAGIERFAFARRNG